MLPSFRLLLSSSRSTLPRFLSSSPGPVVTFKWLGSGLTYQDGLHAQASALAAQRAWLADNARAQPLTRPNPRNLVLLLEHSPVYTVGLRSSNYSADEEARLRSLGADFARSDRGGLITFHGPGQLVAYPCLDLASFPQGGSGAIRWYVQRLEAWVAAFCRQRYGILAQPIPDCTGVWVPGDGRLLDRKIAAIGIHVTQRRLTSHGLALNTDVDLRWFQNIVPCGITGKGITSQFCQSLPLSVLRICVFQT